MLRGLFGRLQMEEEVQFVLPFQQFLEWERRYLLIKSKTGTYWKFYSFRRVTREPLYSQKLSCFVEKGF